MTRMLTLMGLVALLAMTGCENQGRRSDAEFSHMPPPSYQQTEEPEPMPAAHDQADPMEPAPAPEPVAADDSAPQTYTVREGDTLWSIAERIYGDGQKWRDIDRANPGVSADELRVGQELTLP